VELLPNHPNPFNPSTTLSFSLARAGHVRLSVYDLAGRLVRTLVDGEHEAGTHRVVWNGTDATGRAVGAGVYFVRVETPQGSDTRKIALIE